MKPLELFHLFVRMFALTLFFFAIRPPTANDLSELEEQRHHRLYVLGVAVWLSLVSLWS